LLDGERVAIVTNVPAPYRLPLFEHLHRRLEDAGAALRVFFLADSPAARPWMRSAEERAFEHELLSSVALPLGPRGRLLPRNLERRLSSFRPTVVVAAGFSPLVAGRAATVARSRGATYGIWSGEHRRMRSADSRSRRLSRRLLARAADFGAAYGFEAAAYLRRLRPALPVAIVRNTSASFAERVPAEREEVRLLAVGDLSSARKGIDVLLDALARAPDLPCRLTVVGGGALQGELAARADERVRFLGPLPPEQAQRQYADADVFLFPSRADVFGLALAEAMGAGLAVVTASAPGAVGDLCVHGRNALVVDGPDPAAWAQAIRGVVEDGSRREALAAAARRTVASRWTIDHSAGAWIAALRLAVLTRRPRGAVQ
jgi:glycosyltransferase involved in cell wall biosynthesis